MSVSLPQVIRLSDCIRVSEVNMDGCPRDTGPFLVETTEKTFTFAADLEQLEDWTQKLCEIAFPVRTHSLTGQLENKNSFFVISLL